MYDLIVLGDAGLDTFLMLRQEDASVYCELKSEHCEIRLSFADKIPVHEQFSSPGGNAANVAVSAGRLGLATAVYAHLGRDLTSEAICNALQQAGVSLDLLVHDEGSSNTATVVVYQGERTILSYHAPRAYRLPELPQARAVYLTSMRDGSETIIPALTSYLQKTSAKLIFQPGSYQIKQGLSVFEDALKHTWIMVVNREEAERLLGLAGGTAVPQLLDGLAAHGPEVVVITDGKAGSTVKFSDQYWHLATIDEIPRVDVTGAGDAFASAFAGAMLNGIEPAEALRWGLLQASGVIQKVGAQAGLHSKLELEQLLPQYQHIQPEKLNPHHG